MVLLSYVALPCVPGGEGKAVPNHSPRMRLRHCNDDVGPGNESDKKTENEITMVERTSRRTFFLHALLPWIMIVEYTSLAGEAVLLRSCRDYLTDGEVYYFREGYDFSRTEVLGHTNSRSDLADDSNDVKNRYARYHDFGYEGWDMEASAPDGIIDLGKGKLASFNNIHSAAWHCGDMKLRKGHVYAIKVRDMNVPVKIRVLEASRTRLRFEWQTFSPQASRNGTKSLRASGPSGLVPPKT